MRGALCNRVLAAIFAFVPAFIADQASTHTATTGAIEIIHPWAEPTTGPVTMAHPTIANNGDHDIVLLSIATTVSNGAIFVVDGQDVPHVVIPAGEILAPGDFAVRLEGLEHALAEGEHFEFMLRIENMDPVAFHMVVGERVEMPAMEMNTGEPMPKMEMRGDTPMPAHHEQE